MAAIATTSERIRNGVIGTLAIVALTLVLAFQLAHWTWVFVAPPEIAKTPEPDAGVDMAAIAKLFGAAPPSSSAAAASTSGLRLKGVVAPDGGPIASAIFSTGSGKDIAVFVDREIASGVTLAEVRPDHVIVSRGGARERIDLETARSSASARGTARGGRAPGFRVNVARSGTHSYGFSRKELDDALRDPSQLNHLGAIGTAPGGGVRLENAAAGSLAQKLGLQSGDVIRKINGQAVSSPGDLARFYQQFATTSAINAEVQRGSQTLQLSYAIQP